MSQKLTLNDPNIKCLERPLWTSLDEGHEKTDLKVKIFVVVIHFLGIGSELQRWPANPSLGMTTTKTLGSVFS